WPHGLRDRGGHRRRRRRVAARDARRRSGGVMSSPVEAAPRAGALVADTRRVLVTDPIAPDGVAYLRQHAHVEVRAGLPADDLLAAIADYDALVVRSETKVTRDVIERGSSLRVIGRAGVGVDNIDVDAATGRGVVVVNAPAGNTIAVAEHTMGLLLALARSIPQANASLRRGEWQRSRYMGSEVRHKVLGIVGL